MSWYELWRFAHRLGSPKAPSANSLGLCLMQWGRLSIALSVTRRRHPAKATSTCHQTGWIGASVPPRKKYSFCFFSVRKKMSWNGPKWGQEDFSHSSEPCQHFGQNGFAFWEFYFFDCFGLQISRFPGSQISKFPDFQVPRFPDFQTLPPRTNSQIPTWPLSQHTQGSNTAQIYSLSMSPVRATWTI